MKSEAVLNNLKKYLLLYGSFVIYSFATICSKIASGQNTIMKTCLFLGVEVLFLGLYALLWQQVLKRFSLVFAMASKGVVVILNLLWALLLFSEQISLFNVIGSGIIIFGIWMVSSDG